MIVFDKLRHEFKLASLLKLVNISKSNFYYNLNRLKQLDKYSEIKELIKASYHDNKVRYGYRRITAEPHIREFLINHKVVIKLMKQLGLQLFC